MPSFLEKEQLVPIAPSIAPADQILGAFGTKQSLFGIGAAQLKNAQQSYASTPLSNPQNQQQLDGLMKGANQQLKSLSMNDLSVGQNQDQAMSVFDPILKDQDIMGDSALTKSWNQGRAKAESDKISGGGKNYNSAALDAINYQQTLFSRSDKSSWKSFYNNKETYNPYYNVTDEMDKLSKNFHTDVIEKDSQNGAYITTTKDSSWYKDKWQQYVETNASPQLKAQIGQQARAEYYRDMLTMPKEAMVQKYTSLRNGLISKQMNVDAQNMMNIGTSLAMFHNSKDNGGLRAQLTAQAAYLSQSYDAKKQALNSPLEGADAIGDVNGLAVGTRLAEGLAQHQYFDRIGDAFAHKDEKMSIKPDYAYLGLKKIQEQSKEFGIRQFEVGRHNRATEQHATNMEAIDMMKAQAELVRANGGGKKKGSGVDDGDIDDPTNKANYGLQPGNSVNPGSDTEQTQKEGKVILDHLGGVQNQYNDLYDGISKNVFSNNLMSTIDDALKDPTRQNFTLSDVADPTKASDGSGGNSNRLAKFLAAAGQLVDKQGNMVSSPAAAYSLTISEVKDKLREIWSDPAMFKKGLEAIKGNDPSVNVYATAAELEKKKQRIDGEHSDIVNQAIPILRTNLGKYASLFEDDYFRKGKIPTRDDIRAKVNDIPFSAIQSEVGSGDITWGDKFKHQIGLKSQDDLYRDVVTDNITKNVLGTLGVNRTAYNSNWQDFWPDKGNPKTDNEFKNNLEILLQGAEGPTKGLGSDVKNALQYAKNYPASVAYVRMNSADEAHDQPYMQMYFKEPTTAAEKASMPKSGLEVPTTTANPRFNQAPLDDRTTLLNNKALKFSVQYEDGTKSNLSIYNTTGDKRNPQFDLNPDFSYQSLDIDKRTGDIKGIITVHKAEEVNNLTGGRPDLLPQAINVDPSAVYNTLSNKLIKNRDAVNEYLKSKGAITNIQQLPDYVKGALQNPW